MRQAIVTEIGAAGKEERKESLLGLLDTLREDVESGEVIEILAVAISADHYHTYGVGEMDRHRVTGLLMELALDHAIRT